MTILVTGATGTVGRHVVAQLLAGGHPVRALTRNPDTACFPDGVDVVVGDLTDAASLAAAFRGATAAHLINFGGDYRPLGNGGEIADLAARAGVQRVTMLGGWTEGTLEPAVRGSALAWTHLRPIEFMGNALTDWGPALRRDGMVSEPYGDRRSAPVHEADIAAVAVAALTEDGHAGQTYPLSGPEVLTPADKVRHIAEAAGRDLRFVELTPDEARALWSAEPPNLLLFDVLGDADTADKIEFVLRVYSDIPEIGYTVTDTVEKVTGRPARTFARWAAEHAAAFR